MSSIMPGENKAWEELSAIDPHEVCRRSGADFDEKSRSYSLKSFGWFFYIKPDNREILNQNPEGEIFLKRLAYFFRLSVLWYLVKAKDMEPSGKLIKPTSLPGGDIFFRGTHVLPLDAVARKYAHDKDGFIAKGIEMGGKKVSYGDAAIELYPLPKIPVTLILWLEDDEFPSRADLLLDSSCPAHLPLDILWSISMMSTLVFL